MTTLETTKEFLARMTREAREGKGIFELSDAEDEKPKAAEEEKVEMMRRLGSDVRMS
jgi:hypothetical protein